MAFEGFPRKLRYLPVPSPLLGPLLEEIDDLSELKLTLRLIWLLHQKRGFPRYVTLAELLADRTLVRAVANDSVDPGLEIQRALDLGISRGTLLGGVRKLGDGQEHLYMLNTDADRRVLPQLQIAQPSTGDAPGAEAWVSAPERPNIFSLYEDNIGVLSPLIADELKEAEEAYPQAWIEDAVREAVTRNRRSWRYVATILERWEREGRSDGGAGRHTEKTGYQEYFRR